MEPQNQSVNIVEKDRNIEMLFGFSWILDLGFWIKI
jgi:hypothetical protein